LTGGAVAFCSGAGLVVGPDMAVGFAGGLFLFRLGAGWALIAFPTAEGGHGCPGLHYHPGPLKC